MKSLLSAIIVLGIAASVALFSYQPKVSLPVIQHDPRPAQIVAFMKAHDFAPDQYQYVKTYIKSADGSHIDYRLLIVIALAESSGCKRYLFNNCWGYGSSTGLVHFSSIPEGIAYISNQLGNSPTYAGKSDLEKARTYGPHSNLAYAPTIIRYMREIEGGDVK